LDNKSTKIPYFILPWNFDSRWSR